MTETSAITSFSGEFRFLSNFWPAIVEMSDGIVYPTAEHAYVAHKTQQVGERLFIAGLETAGQAKKYGRQMSVRPHWDGIKLDIMSNIVYIKFRDNKHLAKLLLATGERILVEGNTWGDTFWGVCNGVGQNHLGKILMKVRDKLIENGYHSLQT